MFDENQAHYLSIDPNGFYEVWYFRVNFNEPVVGSPALHNPRHSLWLRLTTLNERGQTQGVGEVWGIWTTRQASGDVSRWASKTRYDFSPDLFKKKIGLELGPCRFTSQQFVGEVSSQNGETLKWNLSLTGESPTWFHVSPLLRKSGLTSSQVCTPLPQISVSGEVSLNGQSFHLAGVSAHQGHIWGKKYAHSWGWAHAMNFQSWDDDPRILGRDYNADLGSHTVGAPSTRLEILTARLGFTRHLIPSPPITALFFHHAGVTHEWTGLLAQRLLKSQFRPESWEFEAKNSSGLRVRGHIETAAQSLTGVTYTDPRGDKLYCYNTGFARLNLELDEPGKPRVKLVSADTAFETASREKYPNREVSL